MTSSKREWNGLSLNINHADGTPFMRDGLRDCFEYRYLGLDKASKDKYGAHVLRAIPQVPRTDGWHYHEADFQFLYILEGWIVFEYEGHGEEMLRKGTFVLQPPGIRHRALKHSDDLEMLEVCGPAEMGTIQAEDPHGGVS